MLNYWGCFEVFEIRKFWTDWMSFFAANRIFHLDLKGAAPKMEYLLKLVPFIKQIGATGVMIEYEDMFPFAGDCKLFFQAVFLFSL